MVVDRPGSHEPACVRPDVEDHTLMEEITLLGAVIAEVEGRVDHLSLQELDLLLERAGAATPAGPEEPLIGG